MQVLIMTGRNDESANEAAYLYLMITVSTCWHLGHSNVRLSWSALSGSMRVSNILVPHFGQSIRSPAPGVDGLNSGDTARPPIERAAAPIGVVQKYGTHIRSRVSKDIGGKLGH